MHTSSAQEPEQSPELSSLPVNGRMSRRMFLQAGLAVTAGGALLSAVSFAVSGCALRADEFLPAAERRAAVTTIPSREDIQLVYQDWRTDWFPALVEDMLAEFHDQHPDIRVFFTPDPDNLAESMLADMQAGTAPDLFWGGSTFFPTWAQRGYLLDLRPFVAEDLDERTIAEWDPAQYRAFFLPDGMQYGLPKHHGVVALYYNKDLFDRQGVPYPSDTWTYTDYLDAMQQLTDIGGVRDRDLWGSMIDVSWERLQIHINAWGGHLVAPYDAAYCVADKPAAIAALEWLRTRMWDEHVMAGFSDVQYMSPRSAFINQRVAMVEEGSWVLHEILLNSDFRVGVAPLPKGPTRRVSMATTDGFGIYNRTEYPAAAWELLKFLTGERYGLALAEADFLQPARASLIDDWMRYAQMAFPDKATELDLAVFTDGHRRGDSVTIEIADNMGEVYPQLTTTFEQIFTFGQAPVSVLHAICTQINQWQQSGNPHLPHLLE